MQTGHQLTRGMGVSVVVVAGRDKPGWSAEIGGGISDEIGGGDGVRGGVGQGADWGHRRRQGGVSGSNRIQWGGVERGGGGLSLEIRRERNHVSNNVVYF